MQSCEKNCPSFSRNVKYYFLDYCDRTSLHGFNFLTEPKRTFWERVWWTIIITVAIYLNILMIYQSYVKWKTSPILVTFATQHTTIWQVPFPAVTICPEIKSTKDSYNYTDHFLKKEAMMDLTPDDTANFNYMALLCGAEANMLDDNYTRLDNAVLDFLYDVQPDFTASILSANWRGKNKHDEYVTDMFSPIITSQGICHTFNIMDRSEFFTDIVYHFKDTFSSQGKNSSWSADKGYLEESDMNTYPRRTMVAGTNGGLSLTLHVSQEDMDHACGESFQGFRVVLHPPDEIPRIKQKYFRVPLDHSVVVAIKPKMMTTPADLKMYSPPLRQCYFNDERPLQLFKVYNQENCMLECLANFTMVSCGCVSLHTPRQNSTPICGAAIKPCLEKAKSKFTLRQENYTTKCDCLPSCNTLEYNTEISQSRWNWKPYIEVLRQTKSWRSEDDALVPNAHFSQLVVFYKDMQFITSERSELYSTADFLSNCGGLLGLFTGATFISLFEVIYYLTFRYLFNMYIYGSHNWSGSKKLVKDRAD